jgi:tellurite resistance protein
MIERIRYTPIALFACPLGFLGLTLATLQLEKLQGFAHVLGGFLLLITLTLFILVLLAYTVKAVRSFASVAADWAHPVRCNFFAVISGSFALLGLAILPFSADAALPVWVLGAASQLAVTLGIASKWIGPQVFESVTLSPAQFLPAVGNVLVPLAGVPLGFPEISWFFFSIGLVLWMILTPILIGRLVTQAPPPETLLPTLVILIAPPSLMMMDYLRLDANASLAVVKILYYTSVMFFLVVLTQVPRLARIKFALSWWAFTFPVAAFTVGTLTFAELSGVEAFRYFSGFLYAMLLFLMLAVTWRTLRALIAGQVFVADN